MTPLKLNEQEMAELQSVMRKQTGNAALARRARCVLLCATGVRRVDIRRTLGCDDGFISRWTRAYAASGLAGLVSHHPGRAPVRPVAKLEARVLERTLKTKPRDGSTHWSSRKLADELGDVSFSAVQRIWRKHGVRPHRLDTHMVSDDPDFETKAAEVIGLYLQPPEHAVVFCVDDPARGCRGWPSRRVAGGQHHAFAHAELHLARRQVGDHHGELAHRSSGL
jgi:transposase